MLLVIRAFEVIQVLEGDLLEDRVNSLRIEALADVLQQVLGEQHKRVRIAEKQHPALVLLVLDERDDVQFDQLL